MPYTEAPNEIKWTHGEPTIFLAGGITDCPNWQAEARAQIEEIAPLVHVLNPRRSVDIDWTDSREQIEWEFYAMAQAESRLFWFPASESHQAIALYELGRWLA